MKNNEIIINQFRLLIKQIKLDIDFSNNNQKDHLINMFRLRSVQQVLNILEKFPDNIISSNQLKNIKNVGKKSLQRIDEILTTGKLAEITISDDLDKYLNIISSLEDVFGIGKKKAYELFKTYKIKSIKDLQKKYNSGEIKLSSNIIKGLKYVDKIKEKIPRAEIDELNIIIKETIIKIDPKLFGIICGSYRRQSLFSNDVDLVLVHTDIKKNNKKNYIELLIKELKKQHIIIDSFTGEDVQTKYMGIYRLNNKFPIRRIDIRYIPYESFYSAILYFTGPKDFNKKMRQVAMSMNYLLNEYGLYNEKNKMFKVKSEKDIFKKLNMEYLEPEKRS